MGIASLYKYGSLGEHSEALFSTPTIWFSSPASLNDPFECKPWFTFEGTDEQFRDIFRIIVRQRFPKYQLARVNEEAEKLFAEGRHADSTFLETFRSDVIRMLASRIGLCCLSRSKENILMWSHYGNKHEGFCLGFAATDSTPFFGEAQEVKYAHSFPVVDFFKTPHDVQVDLIFLTKFAGWQYEGEYRMVDHQSGAGLHSYPPELLESVTFGLRMPEPDKAKIRQWVKKRGTEVKFFQAKVDRRDFRVLVEDAGDA